MKFIKPRKLAEANIQAELYHRCREMGISCYLEYRVKMGMRTCRFDVVIMDKFGEIKMIIEVKSYVRDREPNRETKQIKRYSLFGVPVVLITKIEDIENLVGYLKTIPEIIG